MSSTYVNVTGRFFSFIVQISFTLILVRILVPGDFGIIAMVMPVIAVFSTFGELGLTNAVLQREKVTARQLSTLFYISLGVSFILSALLFVSAPMIERFYNAPQVLPVTRIFSLVFLASGLSALQVSILQRDLRFGVMVAADILSQVISGVVAVFMALNGWGFLALAWRSVLQPFISTAVIWTGSGWLPGRPEWSNEVRSMLGFGGYSAGFNLFNSVARRLDNVLIGWRYGHAELGPYAVSYRLFFAPNQMITMPLGQVVIPALARLASEPERFKRWYLYIVRLMSLLIFPPFFSLSLFSPEIVHVVLGDKWGAAVPIARWLLPIAAVQCVYATISWIMLAVGRADRRFQWGVVATIVFAISFVVGLPWKGEGVAAAYSIANILIFLPAFWWATRGTSIRVLDICIAMLPAAVAVAVCMSTLFLLDPFILSFSALGRLSFAGGVVCLALLGGGAFVLRDKEERNRLFPMFKR